MEPIDDMQIAESREAKLKAEIERLDKILQIVWRILDAEINRGKDRDD